jgi:hypothetical protein
MNDCDNCKHAWAEEGDNCATCQAAGRDLYPGWEGEETSAAILEMDVPIMTLPKYLASAKELVHNNQVATEVTELDRLRAELVELRRQSENLERIRLILSSWDSERNTHAGTSAKMLRIWEILSEEFTGLKSEEIGIVTESIPELVPVQQETIEGILRVDILDPKTGDSFHSNCAFTPDQMLFVSGIRIWPLSEQNNDAHRLVMAFGEAKRRLESEKCTVHDWSNLRVDLHNAEMSAMAYYDEHRDKHDES